LQTHYEEVVFKIVNSSKFCLEALIGGKLCMNFTLNSLSTWHISLIYGDIFHLLQWIKSHNHYKNFECCGHHSFFMNVFPLDVYVRCPPQMHRWPQTTIITLHASPKSICAYVEEKILAHLPKKSFTFHNFCI